MDVMLRRYRLTIVRLFFVLFFTGVLARIWYVQDVDTFITRRGQQEWTGVQPLLAVRGKIYDALGNVLAVDVPAYDIDMDAGAIQAQGSTTVARVARGIAAIVKGNAQAILKQVAQPGLHWLRMYPYMVRVPYPEKQRLVAMFARLGLSQDIHPYKTYRRVYPNGTFASEVLGFTGHNGQGAAGIERYYNSYLQGHVGSERFTQDVSGHPIPFRPIVIHPATPGDNLDLTINPLIQRAAQQALAVVEKRFAPAHAAIIVADPNTGAILAMATLPHYDPNRYWQYPSTTLYTNWAISDPFEPGSTFKPYTLTGALTTHAIHLQQTYLSGVIDVNGVPIRDWNLVGWGRLTYAQAMIYSSNVGFVRIGQAEGVNTFYRYLRLYGFTHPTGIDLPGEAGSIIFPEQGLNPVDFATMTFGQGLAVTPIQQVAAIGAIANGGHLLTPYLVQKIVSPTGKVVYRHTPHVVRRVASPAIMKRITKLMVATVNQDPQGAVGVIPGYQVAGKTGTAEIPKPGGGYYANLYNLSFVGFAPANHPAAVVLATVNEPHHTAQWGDWVATPAARFVLQRALSALHVPPQQAASRNLATAVPRTQYVTVPRFIGQSVQSATRQLAALGLGIRVAGVGGPIEQQWPRSGTHLSVHSLVAVGTEGSKHDIHEAVVPDLIGLLATQALHLCAWVGLTLHLHGAGYAVAQSIPFGRRLPLGAALNVTLR